MTCSDLLFPLYPTLLFHKTQPQLTIHLQTHWNPSEKAVKSANLKWLEVPAGKVEDLKQDPKQAWDAVEKSKTRPIIQLKNPNQKN